MALDATALGQIASGLVSGGGVGSAISLLDQIAKLINHFTEDDPVKQAKINREFITLLRGEIGKIDGVRDATEIIDAFNRLYESI